MPFANQPKGKRFRRIDQAGDAQGRSLPARSRLAGHASGWQLVATTDDVNAPTPSFVLAAALSHARKQEQAAQDRGAAIDYKAVMGPDLASFVRLRGCLQHPTRFGRGLHVHPLGRGSHPRPLRLLRRPGRTRGRRGAGQAGLRDQTRAAVVLAGRRRRQGSHLQRQRLRIAKAPGREINPGPALLRSTCPRPLRASSFGCGGYSRSRCVPCSNRAPRCRSR